jgi:hypothetical protein
VAILCRLRFLPLGKCFHLLCGVEFHVLLIETDFAFVLLNAGFELVAERLLMAVFQLRDDEFGAGDYKFTFCTPNGSMLLFASAPIFAQRLRILFLPSHGY